MEYCENSDLSELIKKYKKEKKIENNFFLEYIIFNIFSF